jgi:hypothetical protein
MKNINFTRQSGMVSIIVTMVLMIVISLLVLGFTEIAQAELRNTTDDQLSIEAYYAAETGVNDAVAVINNDIDNGRSVQNKTTCDGTHDPNYTLPGTIYPGSQVSPIPIVEYSCLLVNAEPKSLSYDVGYNSTVIPIISNATIGSLKLDWYLPNRSTPVGNCNTANPDNLPQSSAWDCNFPILRVDLVDATGNLVRGNWPNITSTMFLVPTTHNTAVTIPWQTQHGSVTSAQCLTGGNNPYCQVTISGLTEANPAYYLRVTTLYRSLSPLAISATTNVPFYNAEATIDSTGRAQDELRRILVSVDLSDANSAAIPSAALITEDSVCKQFQVSPTLFTIAPDSYMQADGGPGTSNLLCQASP